MLNYAVVIPARYESTRLPGKPLMKIAGREMIVRTWERTIQAVPNERVWVAVDDERIASVCRAAGAQTMMTSPSCPTGTDRLYEFATKFPGLDFIINVQGDEPIINPRDIELVLDRAQRNPNVVWNGVAPIVTESEWRARNVPKVVFRKSDFFLLYMSRSPIPANKFDTFDRGWKQICIYSFPIGALNSFGKYGRKTTLENIEDIEILRFLELGIPVHMIELSGNSRAVDTFDDLAHIEQYLSSS